MNINKVDWCIEQHRKTNHYYDLYLPYEFHLRMVNQAAMDFQHLLDGKLDYRGDVIVALREVCLLATWGHDLIEDTRTSYNDVKDVLGQEVADIIYAVSNEKGKTRAERANDKYYEGIRNTPGAVFVKLCDRIANAQYSKMTKSSMFKKYKLEQPHFEKMLGRSEDRDDLLEPMFAYLENLFNEL
jgi:(p)ppGpp synthase/HD superfamily hydrolase